MVDCSKKWCLMLCVLWLSCKRYDCGYLLFFRGITCYGLVVFFCYVFVATCFVFVVSWYVFMAIGLDFVLNCAMTLCVIVLWLCEFLRHAMWDNIRYDGSEFSPLRFWDTLLGQNGTEWQNALNHKTSRAMLFTSTTSSVDHKLYKNNTYDSIMDQVRELG